MSESAMIAPWIAAGAAILTATLTMIFGFVFNRRLEALKSQLNLQVHVHRVKFEKEFQVLQDLWKCLIHLRDAGSAFTPGFKSGKSDEEEDEERFFQAYIALLRNIDAQKPFFPREIFDLLEEYRKSQYRYFTDHQFITQPDFQRDWVAPEFWEKRKENRKEIEKLVEDVCEAIRNKVPQGGGA